MTTFRRKHDLETLGFPVHSQVVIKAVSQIINHCLECTGVGSEEPNVVNPAEVRKGLFDSSLGHRRHRR